MTLGADSSANTFQHITVMTSAFGFLSRVDHFDSFYREVRHVIDSETYPDWKTRHVESDGR